MLPTLALLLAVGLAIAWLLGRHGEAACRQLLLLAALGSLAAYLFAVGLHGLRANYNDHIEPSVASLSWLSFECELPLYHDLDSPRRYALPYGPALFLVNWAVMKAVGASIFASKLSGLLAGVTSLALSYFCLRKLARVREALALVGLMALAFLMFKHASFWNRGDALIVCLVSLAMLGAVRGGRITALVLVSLALGVGANVKVHALLYFLPALALLHTRHGMRCLLGVALGASLLGALPFLVFPQVSIRSYVLWLLLAARHGIDPSMLMRNLEMLLFLSVPALPYVASLRKQSRLLSWAALLAALAVLLITSKPGAGVRHLIPLLPVLYFLSAKGLRVTGTGGRTRYVACVALALYAATGLEATQSQYDCVHEGLTDLEPDVIDEIEKIIESHPGARINMGYSTLDGYPYAMTYYRPLLSFHGHPCLLDGASVMDLQKSGIELPAGTLDALRSCEIDLWLIPRDTPPFRMRSYYHDAQDEEASLFGQEFERIFLERYRKIGQTRSYDLWGPVVTAARDD